MMNISRQAVYQYQRRRKHDEAEQRELLDEIHALRHLMPRVGTRKLKEHLGEMSPGRDKLFEIMREHGLLVKRRRKYAITTQSNHLMPVYPNLLPLAALDVPNRVWVADQTYIRLKTGFCYLSLVTDLYSRKIVGFSVHPTLEATGPMEALKMALRTTKDSWHGLIHHSDRGSQYCSSQYIELLTDNGIRISMTDRRRPDQNAVAERVNGILKTEFYLDTTFESYQAALPVIARAIYVYNNIRLHQSLGLTTPSLRYAA
jgi:putative transposase